MSDNLKYMEQYYKRTRIKRLVCNKVNREKMREHNKRHSYNVQYSEEIKQYNKTYYKKQINKYYNPNFLSALRFLFHPLPQCTH